MGSDRLAGVEAWYRHRHRRAEAASVTVTLEAAPVAQGYSNELLFLRVQGESHEEALVVRCEPTGPPLFPAYDLGMQVAVQEVAGAGGVPVAGPIVFEDDTSWLGCRFLVMPWVPGRHPGEVPTECRWLMALPPDDQRLVQTSFLDALAAIHRLPWAGTGIATQLRGADGRLGDELRWWEDYAVWACAPASAEALLELFAWCRRHLPTTEPPRSLLWGDVRLGNVVFDERCRPAAVLDWEMATIGPAESDLAWFTALSGLTERFFGTRVPGFLDRDEVVAHHERALGRPLLDMGWHEVFAMARAATVSVRTQIVDALAAGTPAPDPAAHPVVRYTALYVERL